MRVETLIHAPLERCFDLARSADFHVASTASTGEKITGGVTTGLLKLGDEIEFEARHFGVTQRLSAKVTSFERPNYFRDSQVNGIFRHFDHDHFFEAAQAGTRMRDVFMFECPLGLLGKVADPIVTWHLFRFLTARGQEMKKAAEGETWRAYL